jgi:hypothetical protein
VPRSPTYQGSESSPCPLSSMLLRSQSQVRRLRPDVRGFGGCQRWGNRSAFLTGLRVQVRSDYDECRMLWVARSAFKALRLASQSKRRFHHLRLLGTLSKGAPSSRNPEQRTSVTSPSRSLDSYVCVTDVVIRNPRMYDLTRSMILLRTWFCKWRRRSRVERSVPLRSLEDFFCGRI